MKISRLIIALSAATFITTANAQDVRGKLQELEQQARAAKEAGRADEAQAIVDKIHRIKAEHKEDKGDGDKLEMAKRKLEELRKAGKGDEAEQLERRIRDSGEKRRDGDKEKGGDERRQHIGEAIRHLRAAGLNEPAKDLENLVREHEKMGKEEGTQRAMRDMAENTQRALRDTHEQMAKMARTIEELREQVNKLGQK